MNTKEWLVKQKAELTPQLELRRAAYEQMFGAVQLVDYLIANVPVDPEPQPAAPKEE